MFKKTLKYTDFMEQERTEDLMFHLTETDWNKWMAKYAKYDGVVGYLRGLMNAKDVEGMTNFFDEMISISYGVMAGNGRNFVKNAEVLADFKSSAAYDALFMELLNEEGSAQAFLTGIMPKKMMEAAKKKLAENPELYKQIQAQGADPKLIDELLNK